MDYCHYHHYNHPISNSPGLSSHSSSSAPPVIHDLKEKKLRNNGGSSKTKSSMVKLSTDPQSVAARLRRHRISERFKILQSLVPGGQKLDTVSMLDETIHYVKFLKTQIWLHHSIFTTLMAVHDHDNDESHLLYPVVAPPAIHHDSLIHGPPQSLLMASSVHQLPNSEQAACSSICSDQFGEDTYMYSKENMI